MERKAPSGKTNRTEHKLCPMQIDLAYTGSPTGAEAAALQAVSAGYTGLWTSESKHDPFLTLALAGRTASELALGTGIAVATARSPFTLAQSAWDLALLSRGRFRLGLGSQVKAHVTRRFSMPWDRPIARMRETVLALRAIWHAFQTGEKLHFEGEFFRHTLLTPNFSPGPSPYSVIPIGLAAVGPQMTRLAGEVADFVLLHPFTHPKAIRALSLPHLRLGEIQRQNPIEVVGSLFAFLEDDEFERRRESVRNKVAFYGSTPAYHAVLQSLGEDELAERLHGWSREGQWKQMGQAISEELLAQFCVTAPNRDELFARVRERFGGLYDRVILTVPGE